MGFCKRSRTGSPFSTPSNPQDKVRPTDIPVYFSTISVYPTIIPYTLQLFRIRFRALRIPFRIPRMLTPAYCVYFCLFHFLLSLAYSAESTVNALKLTQRADKITPPVTKHKTKGTKQIDKTYDTIHTPHALFLIIIIAVVITVINGYRTRGR